MGIDAQTFSATFPKGLLLRVKGDKALQLLLKTAESWPLAAELGPNFQITATSATTAEISLLPVADPIRIEVTAQGISAGFRSSNGGAGFHTAAVDLLDHLQQRLGLSWTWTGTDGSPPDETGYATTRNVAALQQAMAGFVQGLARIVTQQADSTNLTLCLPTDLHAARPGLIAPVGPLPADWPARVTAADPATLTDLAAGFLVWPAPGCDARFWQTLLRAQLWQQAEWRPPVTEACHLSARQIKHTHRKASAAPLPLDLTAAYAEWLAVQTGEDVPTPDGIGYRRGLLEKRLYQSWAMRLPGYLRFLPGEKADFEHPAFWFGTTSMTLNGGPAEFTFPENFLGPDRHLPSGPAWRKTAITLAPDGGKVQSAMIVLQRNGATQVLLLTLSSHLDWPFDQFDNWTDTVTCPDLAP